MASTSGVADAATRSLPKSMRRSLIHRDSMYVNACVLGRHKMPETAEHSVAAAEDVGPAGTAHAVWCEWREAMLYYAMIFLVVGLIAGALGVSGVAAVASQIAW